MDIFPKLAEQIIKEQEGIIGPVALEQASKVPGLKIDWKNHEVVFEGDQKSILEELVETYRDLFGLASVEVCREAVKSLISGIPKDQLPPLLV